MTTLKTFIHERAAELRKSPNAIDRAIRRGNFVGLRIFHHNKRVVEVVAPGKYVSKKEGHDRNRKFVLDEAKRYGLSASTIYLRIRLGRYREGKYVPSQAHKNISKNRC